MTAPTTRVVLTAGRSPKLTAYLLLAGAAMVAALVSGHGELLALGVPFIAVLVWTLTMPRPQLHGVATPSPRRLVEGEVVTTDVELWAAPSPHHAELLVTLVSETKDAVAMARQRAPLRPRVRAALEIVCPQLGQYTIAQVDVLLHDPLGVMVWSGRLPIAALVSVYPVAEPLARLASPRQTQLRTGNHRSRARGEGIEYAGSRPYLPGDQVRRVNARLSSRGRALAVNEYLPERNTDIVLLLDTFTDLRWAGRSSLSACAHVVASLADAYLGERDRVGFAEFGGFVRWLLPGSGHLQLQRILEALLHARTQLHYAWAGIDRLPPRLLPSHAFVILTSPLIDERVRQLVLDLAARRRDTAVLEVSPHAFMPAPTGRAARLARRAWSLERGAGRRELRSAGVAVSEWSYGDPLAGAVHGLEAFRRAVGAARP